MNRLLGIHHVTAIVDDPQENIDFYTNVLGLRLVKQTVNFDDPYTYHLYYGDDQGHPGTINPLPPSIVPPLPRTGRRFRPSLDGSPFVRVSGGPLRTSEARGGPALSFMMPTSPSTR